jgi:acyl-CoA dehydrogenase
VLSAAEKMDKFGVDAARADISMLKIVAPKMCEDVSSRAMQIFGGMGVCQDTPLAHIFTISRFCRIADGPDEVHMSQLAKLTIKSLARQ